MKVTPLAAFVSAASAACPYGSYQCDASQTNLQLCSYDASSTLSWTTIKACPNGTVCNLQVYGCVESSASPRPTSKASSSTAFTSSSSRLVTSAAPQTSSSIAPQTSSSAKPLTTSTGPSSSTAATTSSVPSPGLPGCANVWSSGQSYSSGSTVSYNKNNFSAKWYQNAGSNPSVNSDGGWINQGPCDPSVPTQPGGGGAKPPVATNLAQAREYAASLSQDPNLLLLKSQARTNLNVDGVSPGNSANPANVKRVESIMTRAKWDFYFSFADPVYTYANFLKSVAFFPAFCDTYPGKDSDAICKKLLATMFAHFAQETGAHDGKNAIPEWRQSLAYVRELSCTENNTISGCYYNNDCVNPAFNKVFPCGKGPNNGFLSYFGRGAHQLSYSFNYGPFSLVMFNGDPTVLLNNPSLVADTWLNLASAIFFFLYPQPPKPSMLGVIDGTWVPSAADIAAGRTNDFPSTIQIINGECAGSSTSNAAQNRINYYKAFMADMGLSTANDNLKCAGMGRFDSSSSSGSYGMYWTGSYLNQNECQLVSYQTNFNALMDGPNYNEYIKCVELTFDIKLK
ncbi:lysozyme-like domain-containing protein [Chytriomyces cf. hyalinus JEL632]|nr:lysozyme-like domain-containing protein [Chytriomyces cf. hyalinus JEL632]